MKESEKREICKNLINALELLSSRDGVAINSIAILKEIFSFSDTELPGYSKAYIREKVEAILRLL